MRGKTFKNKKKIIIAIVVGILPTVGIFNMMNSQKVEMAKIQKKLAAEKNNKPAPVAAVVEVKIETSNAVLANTDINKGERITIDKIIKKEYKKEELPQDFFNNETFVLGKIARDFILQGKIITKDDLLSEEQNLLIIPNGMRAINIPAHSIQGLAPYMSTGSKIDIYTVKTPSELIAQNIKIIALDSNTSKPTGKFAPPAVKKSASKKYLSADKASGITILVPGSIADKVVNSMIQGKLQFITRGQNDNKLISKAVDLPPPPITEPLPFVPESVEEEKIEVDVYTGSEKKTYEFDGDDIVNYSENNNDNNTNSSSKITSKDLNELLKLAK